VSPRPSPRPPGPGSGRRRVRLDLRERGWDPVVAAPWRAHFRGPNPQDRGPPKVRTSTRDKSTRPLRGIVPSARLAKDRVRGSLMFGSADGRRRIANRQSPISCVIDTDAAYRSNLGVSRAPNQGAPWPTNRLDNTCPNRQANLSRRNAPRSMRKRTAATRSRSFHPVRSTESRPSTAVSVCWST